MTAPIPSVFVVLGLVLSSSGCGRRPSVGPPSASEPEAPPPSPVGGPSASGVPSDARADPLAATATAADCPAPVRLPALRLAQEWPHLVGQRVTLRSCRVVRAQDFSTFLVMAEGVRFAVMAPPGAAVCAGHDPAFTVTGSRRVLDRGGTMLPELLFDEECGGNRHP
jgi:hypothetical protein